MDVINQFIVICGWIITIGGATGVIYAAYRHAKKPKEDLEQRLTSMENEIRDIKLKLDSDYYTITKHTDDMNILMRSLFSLIENKITGNNIEGLKKTRDDLIRALTDVKEK